MAKKMDKIFLVYLIILFAGLLILAFSNSLFSDEGTHLMLSVFYRDLIGNVVETGDFSVSHMYQYGIDYLTDYPKLQIAYPPVYHFTAGASFALFGLTEYAGRVVSIIYTILFLAVLYLLVRKYFGSKLAFLAAALFSLSPYTLFSSTRVMQDFSMFFWLLLSVYIFSYAMERKHAWLFALTGLTAALATLSKQMGAFVMVFFILVILFSERGWKMKLKNLGVMILLFSVLVVPYLYILGSVGGFEINQVVATFYAVEGGQPLSLSDPFYWTYYLIKVPFANILFVPLLASFLYYVYRKEKHWKHMLIWFIVFYMSLTMIPHKVLRFYELFSLPFYITAGFYILKVNRKVRFSGAALVAGYFIISLYIFLPSIGFYPAGSVTEDLYSSLPEGGNLGFISDADPLYSSVVMWHLRVLDNDRDVAVYRACVFDGKTREEIVEIIEKSNIAYLIYPTWKETEAFELIEDELDLVFNVTNGDMRTEVYKYRGFEFRERPDKCNYICLTQEEICVNLE
jgi:4-amino-4-deoxy-L-arabinose transferase-like glycosyltransferase